MDEFQRSLRQLFRAQCGDYPPYIYLGPRPVPALCRDDDGKWMLVFYSADSSGPALLEIDGQLSEAEAVAAAQEHLLKHGRLYIEVTHDLDE